MIVFAAITPHTPLLLPAVGAEHEKELRSTRQAFEILKKQLQRSQPDVVLILSPHGIIIPDAFAINLRDDYEISFKEFGDLGLARHFRADLSFIDQLQRALRKTNAPITLISTAKLDYGAGVPLTLLFEKKEEVRLIPLSRSGLDFRAHFEFGKILGDHVSTSPKRIAIIASTNLSHRLSSNSPAGFSPQGKIFDEEVQAALGTKNITRLLTLDPDLVIAAQPCGFRIILMLLGMLAELPTESKILAYEHPFGVGYLTVNFSP